MMDRLSRNPENLTANTGGNPILGRHVCRVVQPVPADEGVLVVEGLGPVVFLGHFSTHHFGLDFVSDGRSGVGPI